MFYILLLIGLIIRLILIPHPGFEADVAYWKGWGLAVSDKGILWLVKNTNYNYPPGFAYILYLINKIYALFSNPHVIASYWDKTNFLYLFLIKGVTVFADLGIVILILKIAKKLNSKIGPILALVYFLHPAVLFDGALWGQVDQFGLFLFLVVIYFLMTDQLFLATTIFTVSFLMKLQNIIFIPLFFIFVYRKYGYKDTVKSLAYSSLAFLIVSLPFFLYHEFGSLIYLMTVNSDWFPYFSLNAFNLWWILSGLNGMGLSDKNLLFGITNAKFLGLLLFSLGYFTACVTTFMSKRENLLKNFIISSTFVVFAFFHLLTESHDRYLFPAIGLLLLLILFIDKKDFRKTALLTILVSASFFLNLYIAMYFNYPQAVFWPFFKETTLSITLFISLVQIGLFIWFFIQFVFPGYVKNIKLNLAMVILIIAVLLGQNWSYLAKKPVSLSKLKPINTNQEYLRPVSNMTVDSQIDVFKWARLSDNYFFYDKGIGSHADSLIEYSLKGKFSQFVSDYGIDTEGNPEAQVYFSVWGDGRELFHSEPKGRFDSPSTVRVNIEGVDKLALRIFKIKSNFGAHADWLDPALIR